MRPISYREDHDVSLDRLASLFEAAGWQVRAADRDRLGRLVRGSLWLCSAWDGPRLVGFARAISDGATTAYVSDVVVESGYRRRGIASTMMRRLMHGRDEVQFMLRAEGSVVPFYAGLGFEPAADVLRRPRGG